MSDILFFPLKVILLLLDFMIMLLTFGWIGALKKLLTPEPMRSVPLNDDVPSHRVNAESKGGELLTIPFEGVNTIYDLECRSFELYASTRCMGVRQFLGQRTPKIKEFGPDVHWRTFREVGEAAHRFGAALRSVGLVAAPPTTTLKKLSTPCSLAIFENTCPEWMIAALGCSTQSIIVTTIYSTLGMEAVIDAVRDGVISAILCNRSNIGALLSKSGEMPTLKTIIYTNDMVAPGDKKKAVPTQAGIKVVSFDEFVESGSTEAHPPTPPTPNTSAVIMYTSGSTGKPKGVVATHANIIAAIASAKDTLGLVEGDEVYLGYLPLAHILELMSEIGMVGLGCTICYADPRTLTTTGAYPVGALEQFSPTIMAGVPKIWDLIKKGVQAKVSASPAFAGFLVNTALQARTFAIAHGYDTPLFKALVFKKFSKVVGGRLKKALSGGGPLNSEVQVFVRTVFGAPLFQGYGLTETCAVLAIQDTKDLRCGIAGVPIPSVEVKLESCTEIMDKAGFPYLNTDNRDVDGNPIFGRGEILVKGQNITVGYYMMPDNTKEVYGSDGFFRTGDIGQFMSDGSIRIVDRAKNLVKLKGGEYIAVEGMEMAYNNSKFVDAIGGGVCCYGDGDMDRPVALMQLNEVVAMKWAESQGIEGDFDTVKNSNELYAAVMDDMKAEAKKAGLSRLENLVGLAFLTDPWTPENGCLTAANKLQRRQVITMFEKEFEELKSKGVFD